MAAIEDPLMMPRDVAQLLGIDGRTLYRWATAGLIPAVQTAGGYRRYRASDVEAFRAQVALEARGDMLTVLDVVDRFGIGYGAFRYLYRTGRVPFVMTPGGQRRFRLEDVEAALTGRSPHVD